MSNEALSRTYIGILFLIALSLWTSLAKAEDCLVIADAVKTLSNGSDESFNSAFNECLEKGFAQAKLEDEAAERNRPIIIENHNDSKPTKCVSTPYGDSIETVCK